MDAWMHMLMGCTLTVSAVAAALLALTPWLSRRYSARGLHLAWVLVLVCLLLPWRPQAAQPAVTLAVPPARTLRVAREVSIEQTMPQPQAQAPVQNAAMPMAAPAAPQWTPPQLTTTQVAFGIWAAGAVASLAWRAQAHRRFCRRVRRFSRPVKDAQALAQLSQLQNEMGIRGPVALCVCGAVDGPMLTGILRPRILIPEGYENTAALTLVLRHELAHLKRRDLHSRLLLMVAWAVHWFNPLLPAIGRAMALQSEAACDAMVTAGMDLDGRQAYGKMILHSLRGEMGFSTALTTRFAGWDFFRNPLMARYLRIRAANGGKMMMKQRLYAILDIRRKRRGVAVVALLLAAVMVTGMGFAVEPVETAAPTDGVSGITLYATMTEAASDDDKQAAQARMQTIVEDMGYDARGLTLGTAGYHMLADDQFARLWNGNVDGMGLTLFGDERMMNFSGGEGMATETLQKPLRAATDDERAALRARAAAFAGANLLLPAQMDDRPVMAADMLYDGPDEACGHVWVYACSSPIYHVMESQPYDSAEPENNWGYALLVGLDTGKIYSVGHEVGETDFVNSWDAGTDWTARTGQPAPFADYEYMFNVVSPQVQEALTHAANQYGDGLTDAELLQAYHLALYPNQYLEDRHGDWQQLLDDLAAVDSTEALRQVLQTPYKGINETFDGQHSSRMILDMANDHLTALGYADETGPRTFAYSGPYSGGYEVRAWAADGGTPTWDAVAQGQRAATTVSIGREGELMTVNAAGFEGGELLAGTTQPITAEETAWLQATLRDIVQVHMDVAIPIEWDHTKWPAEVTEMADGARVAQVSLLDASAVIDGDIPVVETLRVQADVAGQRILSMSYYTRPVSGVAN